MIRRTRHKYGARAIVIEGIRFDSQAEARRYGHLQLEQQLGEIRDLEPHPKFPVLLPDRSGRLVQVFTYVADSRYRRGPQGLLTVEDVKGVRTAVYKLKKKCVETQYGIQIQEIPA